MTVFSLLVSGAGGCSSPEVQPERRLGAEREYRAAEWAEWSRVPGAVDESLMPLLESRHPEVRRRAALALWRVGEGGAESALLDRLGREDDAGARPAIVRALGRCCGEAASRALVEAAGDTETSVRLEAARALHGREAVALLKTLAVDEDAMVRRAAVVSLAERFPDVIGTGSWTELLVGERDPRVRWLLVAAIARSATLPPSAAPELLATTRSPGWIESVFALDSVGRPGLDDAEAFRAALSVVEDSRAFWVRRAAALEALRRLWATGAEYPDPLAERAVAALEAFSAADAADAAPPGLVRAASSVAVPEDAGAPPALAVADIEKLLADRSPWSWVARLRALEAARRLGPPALAPLARMALEDPVPAVVRRALELSGGMPVASAARTAADSGLARRVSERLALPPPFPLLPVDLAGDRLAPRIELELVGRGTIVLELFANDAPLHCASLLALAASGYLAGRAVVEVDWRRGVLLAPPDPAERHPLAGRALAPERSTRCVPRGALYAVAVPGTGTALGRAGEVRIAQSPRPFEADSTTYGRVLLGMEVIDRLEPGDVVSAVRILHGFTALPLPRAPLGAAVEASR